MGQCDCKSSGPSLGMVVIVFFLVLMALSMFSLTIRWLDQNIALPVSIYLKTRVGSEGLVNPEIVFRAVELTNASPLTAVSNRTEEYVARREETDTESHIFLGHRETFETLKTGDTCLLDDYASVKALERRGDKILTRYKAPPPNLSKRADQEYMLYHSSDPPFCPSGATFLLERYDPDYYATYHSSFYGMANFASAVRK